MGTNANSAGVAIAASTYRITPLAPAHKCKQACCPAEHRVSSAACYTPSLADALVSPKTMAAPYAFAPAIANGPSRPFPVRKAKTSGLSAGLAAGAPGASPTARRRSAPKTMASKCELAQMGKWTIAHLCACRRSRACSISIRALEFLASWTLVREGRAVTDAWPTALLPR